MQTAFFVCLWFCLLSDVQREFLSFKAMWFHCQPPHMDVVKTIYWNHYRQSSQRHWPTLTHKHSPQYHIYTLSRNQNTWIFNSSLHVTSFLFFFVFWCLVIISDSFTSITVAYPIKVTPIHSSNSLSTWQAHMEETIICQTQRTVVPYKTSLHPHKTLYLHRLHVAFMP